MRRFGLLAIINALPETQRHKSDKAATTVRSYVTSPAMYSAKENTSLCEV